MVETEIETEEITFERTTGSVFAALGYPDYEEMERKSRLATALRQTMKSRGLTQTAAARIVGVDQPTLSKILRGRTRAFTTDRLAAMLNALGRDVRIVVEDLGTIKTDGTPGRFTVQVNEPDAAASLR